MVSELLCDLYLTMGTLCHSIHSLQYHSYGALSSFYYPQELAINFFRSVLTNGCYSVLLLTEVFIPSTQPLQIKSVVAPEHVKGYIYVESYKQTHVKAAIEGVGNLRMGFWNQQMVPIKEMTDVLKVVKEVTNLKPKSWVRLKRGLYKDDIAQVSIIYYIIL